MLQFFHVSMRQMCVFYTDGAVSEASDCPGEGASDLSQQPASNRTGPEEVGRSGVQRAGRSPTCYFANPGTCCLAQGAEGVPPLLLRQEVMARAQIIVLHGHQLSAAHHYAVALIMQRCNELRHFCDTLDAALQAKHARLLQTHQLLLCLRQVASAASLVGWLVVC